MSKIGSMWWTSLHLGRLQATMIGRVVSRWLLWPNMNGNFSG